LQAVFIQLAKRGTNTAPGFSRTPAAMGIEPMKRVADGRIVTEPLISPVTVCHASWRYVLCYSLRRASEDSEPGALFCRGA
jgi:hypothetical protein